MLTESAPPPLAVKPGNGEAELAEGLMLVRASTLKMLRLQLAMERRDRRLAIETVDELVALDRSLGECLAALPLGRGQAGLAQELDEERSALNHEKLTLAAEVITRDPWTEPHPEPTPAPSQLAVLEPQPWDAAGWEEALDFPEPRRRYGMWWGLAGLLFVLSAIAAAGFLLGVPPEVARFVPDPGAFL